MTQTAKSLLALAALTVLSCLPATAGDCDEKAERKASIDVAGASSIEIDARAGSLEIVGRDGATQVEAHGTACSSSKSTLERMEITAERRGDVLRIGVEIPEGRMFENSRLDLEVTVPTDLPLAVDDSSGDMRVRGTASVKIDDGSGSIRVEDVSGDVRIDDGSGDMTVHGAAGDVHVRDGSGEIEIDRVRSVTIEEDGSGSMDIRNVDGDVVVRDDGSGSIRVRDVGGDFVVEHDGSGSIEHSGVAGRVKVPQKA